MQDTPRQHNTSQNKVIQYQTRQDNVIQDKAISYNKRQYNTIQLNSRQEHIKLIQYNTIQHPTT